MIRAGLVAAVLVALAAAQTLGAARTRPVGSASGDAILVFSTRSEHGWQGWYVVDSATGALKRVLAGEREPAGLVFGGLTWAPDGVRFAFQELLGDSDIEVVGADGGVRSLHTGQPLDFAWSPDGRQIAYSTVGTENTETLEYLHRDEIHIVDVATGKQIKTRRPLGLGDRLNWSPDGRRLASLYNGALDVEDVTGLHRLTLASQVVSLVGWSRAGDRLAFVREDGKRPDGQIGYSVFVVDLGGKTRRILKGGGTSAAWSPRGALIAVASDNGLFVVGADGTHPRKLLGAVSSEPVWSPDGSDIAVGSAGDVWVVDAAGRWRRRVTEGWRYGYTNFPLQWNPRGVPVSQITGEAVTAPGLPSDSISTTGLLKTTRAIHRLAADGSRVAIAFDGNRDCAETWEPLSGAVARFPADSCQEPTYGGSLGAGGVSGFALAGERLVWTGFQHFGGHDIFQAKTATLDVRRPVDVAGGFVDSAPAEGDVTGQGDLIVFDRWRQSCASPSYPNPCALHPKTDGGLYRVDGSTAVQIGSSAGALTPLAVDGERILVDHENGALELLSRDGTSVRTFTYDTGDFAGALLQGGDLVVLKRSQLDDYDTTTGALLHEWPLSGGDPRLAGLASGVAVYLSGGYVHLLRLADGSDIALPSLGTNPLAELEPAGLFYSYTVDDKQYPGRVVFVPFDQLPLRLQNAAHGLATYVLDDQVHVRFMDPGLVYADGSRIHLFPYDRLPLR